MHISRPFYQIIFAFRHSFSYITTQGYNNIYLSILCYYAITQLYPNPAIWLSLELSGYPGFPAIFLDFFRRVFFFQQQLKLAPFAPLLLACNSSSILPLITSILIILFTDCIALTYKLFNPPLQKK